MKICYLTPGERNEYEIIFFSPLRKQFDKFQVYLESAGELVGIDAAFLGKRHLTSWSELTQKLFRLAEASWGFPGWNLQLPFQALVPKG